MAQQASGELGHRLDELVSNTRGLVAAAVGLRQHKKSRILEESARKGARCHVQRTAVKEFECGRNDAAGDDVLDELAAR